MGNFNDGSFEGVMGPFAAVLGPYAPKVLGALVMVLVAWLAGRLVRAAVGRLGQRARLDERLQSPGFSAMLANVGVGLVWLFALPGLLETLQLKGLLDPVNVMMSRIMGFLPNLVGAIVVFGVGFLVARIVRQIVTGMLRAAGSERLAEKIGLSGSLGEQGLAGLWLSNWVAGLIREGASFNAPALAMLARAAILFFTAALALRQAGLPADIVTIAFGAVVGAVAIGVAVAVGVGGRDVAGRLLEEAVDALRTEPPPSDTPPIRFPE